MNSLRAFLRRPLRPSLLLLQVFLGSLIMTLALSAALGKRAQDAPTERFNFIAGYEDADSSQTYSLFYTKELPDLRKLAPDVAQIAVVSDLYGPTVIVGDTRYALRSGARVSTGYFDLEPPNLVQGTVFTAEEFEKGQDVALLSEGAAKALYGDADPIGQTLNLETDDFTSDTPPAPPTPYRIVGTFTSPIANQLNDLPALYLPYESSGQANPASTLAVRAKPGQGEAARTQLLSAARRVYKDKEELKNQAGGEGQDFMIKAPGEEIYAPNQGIDQDVLVFGLFGAVALVVSSIGIFSATVIEAEERAHEIGIRRALGASAARIGSSLVMRAFVVAVIGSVLGIAGAALLIPVFQDSAQSLYLFGGTRLVFNPLAAATVFGMIVIISVVLGLVPAFRVGRLKPVQALRESV